MSCYIRPMYQEDIAQVSAIDREAFPTMWPPPSYQYELRNRIAHYIVACDDEKTVAEPAAAASAEKGLAGLLSRLGRLFVRDRSGVLPASHRHYIIGFVGFWVMADEAHITSIAVRETYRRQGIGGLLLMSAISLAIEVRARFVTLEVRASNDDAQNLYSKYGFKRAGVRRGYYTDNREDGIIMTTEDITSSAFQARFQELRQASSSK